MNENGAQSESMQSTSGAKTMRLVDVHDVIRFPSKRVEHRAFVRARQLEEEMQVAVSHAPAQSVAPDCVHLMTEIAEGFYRSQFGAGDAEVWIGWRVGHGQDSQLLPAYIGRNVDAHVHRASRAELKSPVSF